MRLTVNGDSRVYILDGSDGFGLGPIRKCGNDYLNNNSYEDDGFGVWVEQAVVSPGIDGDEIREVIFQFRADGIYSVKIERKR